MGAWGGVALQVVVSRCVASFAVFFWLWSRVSECGVSCFEICLARFAVANVLSRRRVVCGGCE